jgi:iron complex outermembrane receptor protein
MTKPASRAFRRPGYPIQLAILTLLTGISSAQAQAPAAPKAKADAPLAADTITEVIVTGTKRATSLQRTPIAITALSAATLQDNHVQTMLDVVSLVPGFQATAQGDHGVTTMTLRGIGNDSAKTQYADPEVASFVDNVYSPRAEGATALMFDIEAIEVLRGPQGTLWGRNSTVGAVNIQTVKPELNSKSGFVEGGIGDYNRYGARGAFNVPLSDTAALRLGFVHEQHDGYVYYQKMPNIPVADQRAAFIASGGLAENFRPLNGNIFAVGDQKYSAQNQTAFRASLLWHITPALKWNASYEKFADRGTPSANLMQQPRAGQKHWSTLSDSKPWINRNSDTLRSRLEYQVNPDMALTYIAGFNKYDGTMRFDQDGGSRVPTSVRSGANWQEHTTTDSNYRSHSHELELQSVGSRKVDWQLGMYYAAEKNDIRFDIPSVAGTQEGTISWQGSFIQPEELVESKAVFGQATWNVTNALHLTGGIRYTRDRRENVGGRAYFWQSALNASPLILNPSMDPRIPGQGFVADVPGNDGVFKGSKPTYLARMNYDLNKDNMVYASIATGYKSGGVQDRGLPYAPETLINYEFGSKSSFMGGKVKWNNAVFYSDFTDFQFNAPVTFPDGGRGLAIINAAGAKVKGFESELAAKLTPNDRLSVTLAVLKAKLGYLIAGSNDYSLPACTADTRISNCLVVTGNKMPHAPTFSTTIQYQHTFNLGNGSTLVPRITARYETDAELSVFNLGPEDRQKAHGAADVGLRYQTSNGWWVDGFVRNVSDAKVKTSAFNGMGPWLSQYKPPRTIGVNTGFDF